MDGAKIQARVDRGFAIAARVAGFPYRLYRPSDPLNPLRLVDRIGEVKAAFDARPSYKFNTPPDHGDFLRYALVDGAAVERGDYLVGERGTLFVADKPTFYGTTCVLTNAVVALRRLGAPLGFGAISDRSDAETEQVLFQGWPASMLYAGRGGGDAVTTPGDVPNPEFLVHLPPIPGIADPRPGDVLTDDRGRRFAIAWWEQSALGWRLAARLMTAG